MKMLLQNAIIQNKLLKLNNLICIIQKNVVLLRRISKKDGYGTKE